MNYMDYQEYQGEMVLKVGIDWYGEFSELKHPTHGYEMCRFCTAPKSQRLENIAISLCDRHIDVVGYVMRELDEEKKIATQQKPKYKKKATIPNSLRKKVFERDEYRCKHCSTHLDLSADHIKPESWGGETTLDNLQTLCRSCNSKKNNRYEG